MQHNATACPCKTEQSCIATALQQGTCARCWPLVCMCLSLHVSFAARVSRCMRLLLHVSLAACVSCCMCLSLHVSLTACVSCCMCLLLHVSLTACVSHCMCLSLHASLAACVSCCMYLLLHVSLTACAPCSCSHWSALCLWRCAGPTACSLDLGRVQVHAIHWACTCLACRAIELSSQAIEQAPERSHGYIARCISRGRMALLCDNRTKVGRGACAGVISVCVCVFARRRLGWCGWVGVGVSLLAKLSIHSQATGRVSGGLRQVHAQVHAGFHTCLCG